MSSSEKSSKSISFSFDIGHSSIGWAVLSATKKLHPEILGTGVVTFPANDCLASTRRDHRRTRRNIRSTRQRIERLKKWLEYQGLLTRKQLDLPGHPAPFLLASAALNGIRKLTALELWHVIRWYAHNRGYDGNSRWSKQEENTDDTEKVKNAKKQLNELGTESMAETICKLLELKPSEVDTRISSYLPYKTLNTAYPRHIITAEVSRLLAIHCDQLDGLDKTTCELIFPDRELTNGEKKLLKKADIKLPKRYHGGLLFGQLVPRFDNRIISRCPITWAEIYQHQIEIGSDEIEAKRIAERDAKVPTKKSNEFLEYRLARILANLKANSSPISAKARQAIFQKAKDQGRLTHKDLEATVEEFHPSVETNLDSYFKLHPDSEDALIFDPVMHELSKAKGSRAKLSPYWKHLPESADPLAVERWKKGESVTLQWIVDQAKGTENEDLLHSEIEKQFSKSKKDYADIEDFQQNIKAMVKWPTGRAPYARPVLKQVTNEILEGFDATKASLKTNPENGENKATDGILYELGVPTSQVNLLLQKRPLTKLTNNPLVRHRLLIMERLLEDMIQEFAPDENTTVTDVIVEVARELREFSGKTAKEIASELNGRLTDFKAAVTYLEKHAPTLPITGGLIRKCRIAMDLGWHCPFTGKLYEPHDLPYLELEHIIPFSTRKTNALHALVLTWPEVNRWKRNRTARQFIIDEGGKPVPNKENVYILTESPYRKFVAKLKIKGHDDDKNRQKARKALLDIIEFKEKEQGFTEGALTQTSHLIKLAMRSLRKRIPNAQLHSIPGIATAEIRKSWSLLGTLGHPEVCGNEAMRWLEKRDRETGKLVTQGYENYPSLDTPDPDNKKEVNAAPICPNCECEQPLSWSQDHSISTTHCPHCHAILRRVPKAKQDIRSLTHLHHALDALTLALITHYFPISKFGKNQSGKIWKALINRNKTDEEKAILRSTQLFEEHQRRDKKDISKIKTEFRLKNLPNEVKEQVITHLAKGRVFQHVPASRSGTKAELMTWGVNSIDNTSTETQISLRQQTSTIENGIRNKTQKERTERADKLLGPNPNTQDAKLKDLKGALIISENFGLVLDPEPKVLPFHQVSQQLEKLKQKNNGKMPRFIRNGMIIKLKQNPPRSQQDYTGYWKIASIKNNKGKFLLDLIRPSFVTPQNKVTWAGMNKHLEPLLNCGFEIVHQSYTGK